MLSIRLLGEHCEPSTKNYAHDNAHKSIEANLLRYFHSLESAYKTKLGAATTDIYCVSIICIHFNVAFQIETCRAYLLDQRCSDWTIVVYMLLAQI